MIEILETEQSQYLGAGAVVFIACCAWAISAQMLTLGNWNEVFAINLIMFWANSIFMANWYKA